MKLRKESLLAAFALLFIAVAPRVEASCAGPGYSFLIDVEVVSCSVADHLIREKIELLAERRQVSNVLMAESVGATPLPLDREGIEAYVQKRLQSGEVVATLLVRRSLRFTDSSKSGPEGTWQTTKDLDPVKYFVKAGAGGCGELGDGKQIMLFAPFQCCDTVPGSNSCMLGLPLALDVPEELLEHSRSDG